ncbi:hypothetical protein F5X96DRAFT_670987 [Biscogniauxia mediterranea]|nr:hypothetical protein F5X96DRAFT_670987 [Biscogniauxia mediterranea]
MAKPTYFMTQYHLRTTNLITKSIDKHGHEANDGQQYRLGCHGSVSGEANFFCPEWKYPEQGQNAISRVPGGIRLFLLRPPCANLAHALSPWRTFYPWGSSSRPSSFIQEIRALQVWRLWLLFQESSAARPLCSIEPHRTPLPQRQGNPQLVMILQQHFIITTVPLDFPEEASQASEWGKEVALDMIQQVECPRSLRPWNKKKDLYHSVDESYRLGSSRSLAGSASDRTGITNGLAHPDSRSNGVAQSPPRLAKIQTYINCRVPDLGVQLFSHIKALFTYRFGHIGPRISNLVNMDCRGTVGKPVTTRQDRGAIPLN